MNNIAYSQNNYITSNNAITSDLYARFIEFLDAKPKTVQTYTRALKQFAKWLSINGIVAPAREDIITYREELKENHKATTVQSYMIVVRLFFQWLEQEGIYPNVAVRVKGTTISKEHKKDYLTASQIKSILPTIDRTTLKGKRDYALFALMITGGLRDIEASRANIEDIRVLGDSTVLFLQGKGKEEKADFVKLPQATEEAIRDYLKDRKPTSTSEPLFVSFSNNSKGARMTTRSISGTIKKILVSAGYDSERLTAHSLRHTAVTLSLIGGNSLQEVQQFARHSNITTTQIYAHNLERINSKCENTIAGAIF